MRRDGRHEQFVVLSALREVAGEEVEEGLHLGVEGLATLTTISAIDARKMTKRHVPSSPGGPERC